MSPRTTAQFEEIRLKSREKIILAAMELFSRQTYHNTSIADIAKEAGVSKGLIYNYFDTKEDIIKGIVEYMMAMGDRIMVESRNEDDPRQELREMIRQTFAFIEEQGHITRLMVPLALEIEQFSFINEIIEEKSKYYLGRLVTVLERMGYEDAEMEAWTLGLMLDGIPLDYSILGARLPIKKLEQYLYKKYNL